MNLQTKLRQLQGGFLSVNRQIVPAPTSKVAYLKQNELKLRLENKACASKKADVNFLAVIELLKQTYYFTLSLVRNLPSSAGSSAVS